MVFAFAGDSTTTRFLPTPANPAARGRRGAVLAVAAGDPARWRENVEKARVQIRPLLRRFDG